MRYFLFLWLLFLPYFAVAVLPDEVLSDAVLEAEARSIDRVLRCVVCQNQTIDESSSELARELRLLVRRRLQAGESREAILAYIGERYGDFVFLSPPLRANTLLLWLSAPLLLLAGVIIMVLYYRRRGFGYDEDIEA